MRIRYIYVFVWRTPHIYKDNLFYFGGEPYEGITMILKRKYLRDFYYKIINKNKNLHKLFCFRKMILAYVYFQMSLVYFMLTIFILINHYNFLNKL